MEAGVAEALGPGAASSVDALSVTGALDSGAGVALAALVAGDQDEPAPRARRPRSRLRRPVSRLRTRLDQAPAAGPPALQRARPGSDARSRASPRGPPGLGTSIPVLREADPRDGRYPPSQGIETPSRGIETPSRGPPSSEPGAAVGRAGGEGSRGLRARRRAGGDEARGSRAVCRCGGGGRPSRGSGRPSRGSVSWSASSSRVEHQAPPSRPSQDRGVVRSTSQPRSRPLEGTMRRLCPLALLLVCACVSTPTDGPEPTGANAARSAIVGSNVD